MSTEFNASLETLRMQKSAAAKVQDWQSRNASETSDIQADKPKAIAPMTGDRLNVQVGASIPPAELEGVCFYPYDAIGELCQQFLYSRTTRAYVI